MWNGEALQEMFKGIAKAIKEAELKFAPGHDCSKCGKVMEFDVANLYHDTQRRTWTVVTTEVNQGWVFSTGVGCPQKRFCPSCARQLGFLE